MFLQSKSWVMDIIRELLAVLDFLVYSLIKWILYIIFDLTSLSTSSEVLNGVYSRIYIILGVFMAFKLSFSFFKYILNPDAMLDKKQGIGKLFANVIIMLSALILIPTLLFGTGGSEAILYRAQKAFLPMLPRILLGVNTGSSVQSSDSTLDQAANDMAVAALGAFFMPSEQLDSVCGSGTKDKKPALKEVGDIVKYAKDTCSNGISVDLGVAGQYGAPIYYTYSYTYLVSLIVGIMMAIAFIGMAIDVAKRVFKLIILEVIAPIPIMSLIDPDAATKGAFGAWLHTLIYTFLDIFIKLGIIYIVIYLIQMIVKNGLFTNFPEFSENPIRVALLIVALIIGLIQFAKEAPKFIKDSLGIKDKGEGGGLTGKLLAAAGGAAAGFAAGALHGDAISGATSGWQASMNAKPGQSAHAWRAGADKAAQLRTGDKNYKTGFAASLQRARTRGQGYSYEGLDAIKKRVKNAGLEQANLQELWQDFIQSGNQGAFDGMSPEDARGMDKDAYRNKLREAMKANAAENVAAQKQQKAYENAMSMGGLSTNRRPGGIAGATSNATHYVASRASAAVTHAGRTAVDSMKSAPIIGGAVRTLDSAHNQHILNEIDRGQRANNYDVVTHQATVDSAQERRNASDFDEHGNAISVQGHIKYGLDSMTGDKGPDGKTEKHDGHFGKPYPTNIDN